MQEHGGRAVGCAARCRRRRWGGKTALALQCTATGHKASPRGPQRPWGSSPAQGCWSAGRCRCIGWQPTQIGRGVDTRSGWPANHHGVLPSDWCPA